MTDDASLQAAGDAIGEEIGLDTSYFVPTGQLDFDPITIAGAVGLILLGGFLEGVRKGLRDQAEKAGEAAVSGLAGAFTGLFKRHEKPSPTEVAKTAADARAAAAAVGGERLSVAAELTELALVRYFRELGMPEADARRLAGRVRTVGLAEVEAPTPS
jgi:hypothetical protein